MRRYDPFANLSFSRTKVQDEWKAGLVFGNLNVSGWRITMATPERPSSSVVNRNVCFQAEAKFASMADIRREGDVREGQFVGPLLTFTCSSSHGPLWEGDARPGRIGWHRRPPQSAFGPKAAVRSMVDPECPPSPRYSAALNAVLNEAALPLRLCYVG